MRHALSTHLLVNQRLTTAGLERICTAGIPAVEIFCARQHFDYRNKEQVAELGYWFKDSPLKLHSLHSPMYNDEYGGRSGPASNVNLALVDKPRRLQCVDEVKRALEVAESVPFDYLVQHLGVSGEEFSMHKLDAAFSSLEDLMLFARHRGVRILLENIPNDLSTAHRLLEFIEVTHLNVDFCFDFGHAQLGGGVEAEFHLMKSRIRSTHVHDNDGLTDTHLFPLLGTGGVMDWKQVMEMVRPFQEMFPLLLEVRESPELPRPLAAASEVFQKLEAL